MSGAGDSNSKCTPLMRSQTASDAPISRQESMNKERREPTLSGMGDFCWDSLVAGWALRLGGVTIVA